MSLYKSLTLWVLLLVSSSSILAFRYAFILFLKCLLASRLGNMAIVRISKDVTLLREKWNVAVVRVRKDVMLMNEKGDMFILFPGKADK